MADMQEMKYRLYMLRRPLGSLILLCAVLAVTYFFSKPMPPALKSGEPEVPLAEQIRTGEAAPPAMTDATKAKLATSHGFQALVSYTDNGFEPTRVSIKQGETVRFTNNSSHDVWIASDGTNVQIYPRTKAVCGSSDLDSCAPFPPMDFWEFTFNTSGEWHVVNNLDKAKGGVVMIE